MKGGGYAAAVGITCVLLGALATVAAPGGQATPLEQTQALYERVQAAQKQDGDLRDQADALREDITALQEQVATLQQDSDAQRAALKQAQLLAADMALTGPGVVVTLTDAPRERIEQAGAFYDINWFLVHDHDLLTVVNLLKDAGAEAISINGVRLQADTAIHCAGPAIYVRDISLAPPFVISAIGNSAALNDAILHGGDAGNPAAVYQELQVFGVIFTVEKREDIMIPASGTTDAARRASHNR